MKLYNHNNNFYNLLREIKQNGKLIHGGYNDSNSQFYDDIYEMNDKTYVITEDADNGITYAVEVK